MVYDGVWSWVFCLYSSVPPLQSLRGVLDTFSKVKQQILATKRKGIIRTIRQSMPREAGEVVHSTNEIGTSDIHTISTKNVKSQGAKYVTPCWRMIPS